MQRQIILFAFFLLSTIGVYAQRPLCGTWVYHYPGYYVDGEEIEVKRDEFLKIDEENGHYYVSIKRRKNGEFYGYSEATQVEFSNDGTLSFNEFYDNKIKHGDGRTSHYYTHYKVWLEGRTLYVKPVLEGYWYDRNGRVQSHTSSEQKPTPVWIYHNEKDNW